MSSPSIDAAIAFLERVLARGPMLTRELLELGVAEGLSKSTVKRARTALDTVQLRDGKNWSTALKKLPEPRRRSKGGEEGTVSMSTILDPAGIDGHQYLREFELWLAPKAIEDSGRGRAAWSPERRATIIGFVARSGSLASAAKFAGVAESTVRKWLDRGEKEEQQLAAQLKAGEDAQPTPHCLFRRKYLMAMGWLAGRYWGVVSTSALSGNVADAKWCLTMQHGVRERIEVDMSPAIEVDELQRRDDLKARMAEMAARRIALAKTES